LKGINSKGSRTAEKQTDMARLSAVVGLGSSTSETSRPRGETPRLLAKKDQKEPQEKKNGLSLRGGKCVPWGRQGRGVNGGGGNVAGSGE